jgi:hypothetical protein
VTGHETTEPDLAFLVDYGDSWIIVEAKPLYKQRVLVRLSREVIDTLRGTTAAQATVIMVGADLDAPGEYHTFDSEPRRELGEHRLGAVDVTVAYSSWAQLSAYIEACGEAAPEWKPYADDVLQQLKPRHSSDTRGSKCSAGSRRSMLSRSLRATTAGDSESEPAASATTGAQVQAIVRLIRRRFASQCTAVFRHKLIDGSALRLLCR